MSIKKLAAVIVLIIISALNAGCKNDNEVLENMEFKETCGNEYQAASTGKTEETKGYSTISAEDAKTIMDENPHAIILDVRTKEEYDKKHIPDSILIPNENISEDTVSELDLPSDSVILIYCRSGNRSKQAASKLAELGYSNIFDFGGIKDWPYETE
ncbi:rhodanese-like domain-containing protein [Aminipila sp.]|uniref:rhodanese-like domain-containing protein n=1 Tax=Aminipila sp. TaxID=2060095 RepID=UPI002897840B|nr:rhodanese-like domain-containing protein [Aminipila sp.]